MRELSDEGRRIVSDVARRHDVSEETVTLLIAALVSGGGGQAQFNIAELGGMGQWSRGGMTMVGDMFNTALKARVDALCADLAERIGSAEVYAPSGRTRADGSGASQSGLSQDQWPDDLGRASSTGSQNDMRYAVFPETRRLAVERGGRVTIYDTGEHRIGGVSQQQSGDQSLTFTSQQGTVRLADLQKVSGDAEEPAPPAEQAEASGGRGGEEDVLGKIERLSDLHRKGALSDDEFGAKKAELLGRL